MVSKAHGQPCTDSMESLSNTLELLNPGNYYAGIEQGHSQPYLSFSLCLQTDSLLR